MANPPRPTITIVPEVPSNISVHLDSAGLRRVYGILVGSDDGVTVRISDTFRMDLQFHPGGLDRSVLENEINRCKTLFPEMVIVGWYSTVDYADEHDMLIHQAFMDIAATPLVYMVLHPSALIEDQNDLLLTVYERELVDIFGVPQPIFVATKGYNFEKDYKTDDDIESDSETEFEGVLAGSSSGVAAPLLSRFPLRHTNRLGCAMFMCCLPITDDDTAPYCCKSHHGLALEMDSSVGRGPCTVYDGFADVDVQLCTSLLHKTIGLCSVGIPTLTRDVFRKTPIQFAHKFSPSLLDGEMSRSWVFFVEDPPSGYPTMDQSQFLWKFKKARDIVVGVETVVLYCHSLGVVKGKPTQDERKVTSQFGLLKYSHKGKHLFCMTYGAKRSSLSRQERTREKPNRDGKKKLEKPTQDLGSNKKLKAI